ncbi:hypothetical protein EJ02DRAFT_450723 [Clathrospora elynae]|uniref:Uncharacterized protein n=1 Tax=Clathrospora elynae TaxID=706981 RepID=A0A6A5T150_9PLEO|nr:hypothetical protein EJ02DRAFT_450723 [Clathrospora elynae]
MKIQVMMSFVVAVLLLSLLTTAWNNPFNGNPTCSINDHKGYPEPTTATHLYHYKCCQTCQAFRRKFIDSAYIHSGMRKHKCRVWACTGVKISDQRRTLMRLSPRFQADEGLRCR